MQVARQADGSYSGELWGHFSLRVSGDEPFRMRRLILFLRLLEVEGPERVIGRTRDERAPFAYGPDPNCGVVRGPPAEREPLGTVLAGRELARSIELEVSRSLDH
ncbi:MAG: hypothetical protein AB1801_09750 [Chloroflexota bacterium]